MSDRWKSWLSSKGRELWGIDPRSLALFRIGLGIMLISDLVKRSISLREHYTGEGVFPLEAARSLEPDSVLFRLYLFSDSFYVQASLFCVAGALALLLIVGYRTRLVSVLSMVFLVSLVRRNPYCTHTGDVLLQAMMFWAMFLPLGATFSLDRKQGRVFAPHVGRLGTVLSVATVAVLLQLVAFYFYAGLFKHRYDVWMRGDALWVFTNIEEYTRSFGLFLKDYPTLCAVLTFFTLVLELGGPLLLFLPWFTGPIRTLMVCVLAGFHIGIQLTVYIGIFEILSIVAVSLFLPPWFWDRLAAFLPRAWTAPRDAFGKRLLHVTAAPFSPKSTSWGRALRRGGQLACGAALGLMLYGNWNSTRDESLPPLPKWIEGYGKQLALLQNWNIFSDIENTFYGWYLVVGQLDDGRFVDVLHDKDFGIVEQPEHFARYFPNHNTRRFWRLMSRSPNAWLREGLGHYLVEGWNRTHESRILRVHAYHVGSVPGRGQDYQELKPLFHYPSQSIDVSSLPRDERAAFREGLIAWRDFLEGMPEQLFSSNDAGVGLVHRLEEKMGGRTAWERLRHLAWVYPGPHRHVWDKLTGDVRIETDELTLLMNIETREGRAFESGVEVSDPDRLQELLDEGYRRWQNDSYWVVMPWKLRDPGVVVRHLGEEVLADGRVVDILGVRFNGVGSTPDNRYMLALDSESGLLEQWAFFRRRKDKKPNFTRLWSGWKEFDGVFLATDKRRVNETQEHDWHIVTARELPESMYHDPQASLQVILETHASR